ncbi:hypothetical protein [Azotobacter vinelandii]|uniref:hypothetical protein n=1 Tax=Azotobacter vinelandii TaxID=354 RepID=UPI0007748DFA|nr:hypothetical protein [Azotobacter vinelandii]
MQLPNWHDLYVDFYNFKVCGDHPEYWGRDAPLWQKPLGHVQLTDSSIVLARWSLISDPFYRTVKESEADHDRWLLYAHDDVENRFLMLSVFGPNAHKHPEFQSYVRTLQKDIVNPWLCGQLHGFEPPEDYEP